MKKLLALILCLTLFSGVISAEAFALNGEAVDLSPAYQKLNDLNNAYAQLSMAYAVKNAYDGFNALSRTLGAEVGGEAAEEAEWYALEAQTLVDYVKDLKSGLSYEGLFILVGPMVYFSYYDEIGADFSEEIVAAVETIQSGVESAISSISSSVGA